MIQNSKLKIQNYENGVSLIITFFIMIIILVIVLSISTLLYSEIKVMRNLENSMISLYAADSGIEKVLYYDRQVVPEGASRGLCSMVDPDNIDHCQESGSLDSSVYCADNPQTKPISEEGCDVYVCNDCQIFFGTIFGDTPDSASYSVEAMVNEFYYSDITSSGTFGGAGRKIQIVSPF